MTQLLAKNDKYTVGFLALEQELADDQTGWLRELRHRAWSRFAELGFPTATRGNERWKYTNVTPLDRTTFRYPFDVPAVVAAELRRAAPWDKGWTTLVFVNGRYAEALSSPPAAASGVQVEGLASALARDGRVLEQHLARYAPFEDEAFTALNTAFLADGALVRIPDGVELEAPVHLVFVAANDGQPTVSFPRTLVLAGRHSKLHLIETYVSMAHGPYLTNATTEVVTGDGAKVDHYRILLERPDAFHVGATHLYQHADSSFTQIAFAHGAALGRNEVHVLLDAPGSSCILHGLYRTEGTQHLDNHINIDHAKPHAYSRVYYKGILNGKSRAIFSGRVLVRKGAMKTDALQHDRNLILSKGAEIYTKPSLEIFADDVKCFHGAAAGDLDEDALFYMRTRGLDDETAKALLIRAFASEIIDEVTVEALRGYLYRLFSGNAPSPDLGGT